MEKMAAKSRALVITTQPFSSAHRMISRSEGYPRPVPGGLCTAWLARELGLDRIVLPRANAREAAVVEGIEIVPLDSLAAHPPRFATR
jgi:predicted ATPase with chaperone activity